MNAHNTNSAGTPYMRDGVLHIDGRPRFVWSADYPYYRDQSADWPRQLDNLKAMNVRFVTCYIPWRHHAPRDPRAGGVYDFTGKLNDRTDVVRFIQLIAERGMFVIVKPGPYIHAETRFGSLPDYVLPQNNPRISRRVDARGNPSPTCWGFNEPPAPMDPVFVEHVSEWFRAVAENVIAPFQYPKGPIVAVQVLNEGIYSDGGYLVDQLHYDPAAIRLYRQFLREKYQTVERYNAATGHALRDFSDAQPPRTWVSPNGCGGLLPYVDWAEFHRYFYKVLAETYVGFLRNAGVKLPMVMNINPPPAARGAALETFVGRYTPPYLQSALHYGYTNWCGVVAHSEDAWIKYKIVGKLARGINMEENWGFDSYDPPYYWSVQPSFFQSMAYLLWGATGLNIYLGVSCDCWTDDLAPDAGGVYMHNHPIAEDGSYRASFATCHQMGALMNRIGDDMVREDSPASVAWGLYAPYAHAASWDSPPNDWHRLGFPQRPKAAWAAWDSFMTLCERHYTANDAVHLAEEPVERLLRHKAVFLEGSLWMDAPTQSKLVEYVRRGGTLVLTGAIPERDAFFAPCPILRDSLFHCRIERVVSNGPFHVATPQKDFAGTGRGPAAIVAPAGPTAQVFLEAAFEGRTVPVGVVAQPKDFAGHAVFVGFSPWQTEAGEWGMLGLVEYIARRFAGAATTSTVRAHPADPRVTIAEFPCGARNRRYFYVLTRNNRHREYHFESPQDQHFRPLFSVSLPAFSGAIVGLESGRIVAAFIKGYNDLDKSAAPPRLICAEQTLEAAAPCDLYFCETGAGEWELSVANVKFDEHQVPVRLPIRFSERLRVLREFSDGTSEPVEVVNKDGSASFLARDMQPASDARWSPRYRIFENRP
jgi:beta-galactosidase